MEENKVSREDAVMMILELAPDSGDDELEAALNALTNKEYSIED